MATNMFKINKKLHFIENLTNDFEKTLDPPVDLLDAPLDSPMDGEFLQLGLARLELALVQEEPRDVHCWQLNGRLKGALTQLSH
jgi:hypothetical protein